MDPYTLDYPPVSLNTPIKKIQSLTLNSPPSRTHHHHHDHNGSIYPNLDDIQTSPTASTMLEKGYSQRLTNNVLSELNSRAQQITQLMGSPPDSQTHQQQARASTNNQVMNRRNKRYSGIHMNKFKQMDSINQHYSVHVRTPSPQKTDTLSNPPEESASKRRRTLNGNDEIVAIPVMQKKETIKEVSSSPMRKISPSKGSMNLNSMLRHTTETGSPNKEEFVKPFPPSLRLRKSSLELAGVEQRFVKPLPFNLTKKSSIPQLNKKASIPQLNKKSSIPQLNKKSSIPTLNKKSSIPNINRSISSHIPQPSTAAPPLPPPHSVRRGHLITVHLQEVSIHAY
ncbi:hypothetical protein G210_3362 [Candida maltosa Xu316]|uniref:Uncharacterized protein n=1 Tax=Candida maltosa (strain Xu316) TaxID=1245528 RepID=M3IJ30_CANMX|nr:hypothetical protein G210_3362 [Candida maltosa Xu316]